MVVFVIAGTVTLLEKDNLTGPVLGPVFSTLEAAQGHLKLVVERGHVENMGSASYDLYIGRFLVDGDPI